MSNKTRKRIWPVSVVAVIGMVAILAALAVTAYMPGVSQAQGAPPPALPPSNLQATVDSASQISLSWDAGLLQTAYELQRMDNSGDPGTATFATVANDITMTSYTDMGLDDGTTYSYRVRGVSAGGESPWSNTVMATTEAEKPPTKEPATLKSSSTSASAGVKLTLDIPALPMNLKDGSSIVLYLEDDYKVPDDIDRGDVYFIATGAEPEDASLNNGGRVFATYAVEISDDDHFGGDDDWDIQIFVPDFDTRDVDAAAGFQAPAKYDSLQLVITKAAGIKNPSEAHDNKNDYAAGYKWSYTVLDPGASVPTISTEEDASDAVKAAAANTMDNLIVKAKISLDDENNSRGYELTVTGSGFNNGTSAAVHVLSGVSMEPSCAQVIREGSRAGIATVGSDDKVAVTFEVTVPTFMAGDGNYICMVDGEGRVAVDDVEQFELEPSIRIVPNSAAAGDTVTVFAQDYPGGNFEQLLIAGQNVSDKKIMMGGAEVDNPNYISINATNIGRDGSATATFDLPGELNESGLEGTVRIDATWGGKKEDTKITITGSQLTLSKSEALANELITITGDGFGGEYIDVDDITIDGVALMVHDDSKDDGMVEVSNAGQFVASVVLWPEGTGSNPQLIAGTHTIKVKDDAGFSGSAVIIIPDPSISVTPSVAGPRDIITITGENWPIDNVDGADPDAVDIRISDGNRDRRYSAFADSAGRFTIEHRVASNVAIPSTNQVRAEMGTDIVKVGSFEVPAAIITVEPAEGQPGDHINLSVDGMPIYQQVARVEIGGRNVRPVGNFSTDATGSVTVDDVLIPGIDPGTYSVLLEVDDTIAIGELSVLAEAGVIGPAAELPGAVEALGDNLVAIFHFDDVGKTWSFYDPRPEFADLNTLSELVNGEAYWVLVSETVEDVVLNNKSRNLTCRGDDCWNLEVW